MAIHILCLASDLTQDAALYAGGLTDAAVVRDFSRVRNGDVVILYTHGGAYRCQHREYKARGDIQWGGAGFVNAATAAANTLAPLGANLDPNLTGVTVVIHACFSAGTVERAPKAANQMDTFAGQFCSALSNGGARLPGLKVIGYQGATKAGSAGFLATQQDLPPIQQRATRRTNPNAGDKWQVTYVYDNNTGGVAIQLEGASVTWR